jgi:hypothetical protein
VRIHSVFLERWVVKMAVAAASTLFATVRRQLDYADPSVESLVAEHQSERVRATAINRQG